MVSPSGVALWTVILALSRSRRSSACSLQQLITPAHSLSGFRPDFTRFQLFFSLPYCAVLTSYLPRHHRPLGFFVPSASSSPPGLEVQAYADISEPAGHRAGNRGLALGFQMFWIPTYASEPAGHRAGAPGLGVRVPDVPDSNTCLGACRAQSRGTRV